MMNFQNTGLLLGLGSHLAYFMHGEHHLEGPRLAVLAAVSPIAMVLGLYFRYNVSLQDSFGAAGSFFSCFYAALFTSITVYRFAFHPLRKFPGPRLARLSKLYHVYLCNRENNYVALTRLHEQYGPVVRVGMHAPHPLSCGLLQCNVVKRTK